MIYVAVVKTNRRSQVPFGHDYHPSVVYFTEVFSMFTGVQWGFGHRTICEEIFVDNESLIIYVSQRYPLHNTSHSFPWARPSGPSHSIRPRRPFTRRLWLTSFWSAMLWKAACRSTIWERWLLFVRQRMEWWSKRMTAGVSPWSGPGSLVVFSGVFLRPVGADSPKTWTSWQSKAMKYRIPSSEPRHFFGGSNNHKKVYCCPGPTWRMKSANEKPSPNLSVAQCFLAVPWSVRRTADFGRSQLGCSNAAPRRFWQTDC